MNAWINLDTKFSTSPVFDVRDGQITNLGVILWRVDFDLGESQARATISSVEGGAAWTEHTFSRWNAGSPWLAYGGEPVALSGESDTSSAAVALQPKGSRRHSLLWWWLM
jgi:hypothetical protein